MSVEDRRGLSWSVRLHRDQADVLDELVDVCHDMCAAQFCATDGYVTSIRRLSGPIEGATFSMIRGRFRGLISVQRYERRESVDTMEIRVVARRRADEPTELAREADRTRLGWGVVGCTASMMGMSAVGLGMTGALSVWAQVLLLLPAIAIWRVCLALDLARDMRLQARLRAALRPSRAMARTHADDDGRWNGLVEQIAAQRDAVAERARMRPFRSPGSALGSVGVRASRTLPSNTPIGPRPVLPLPPLTT
jgi:hypothetical protein